MKPTLGQVEAFYWIARLGSFQAAAAKLNLTQPSVSLRIRNLEDAVGLSLFVRSGRRMRLSNAGSALLPDVRRMIELAERLPAKRMSQDPLRGRLRLGAPESVALSCITDLLGALKQHNSELTVALTIDKTEILRQKLASREVDMAFVVESIVDPIVEPYVRIAPLGIVTHSWVAGPQLGLARRWIEPKHLMQYQIFTQPEPSVLMTSVMNWFGSAGLEPERVSTCNSLSVILRLTAAGAGVSLLPPAILTTELGAGTVQLLKTRRKLVRPRLFVGYQADMVGPTMLAVLDIAHQVVSRSRLLTDS
jgi:DNA-binding transcriptional LysR family regulator